MPSSISHDARLKLLIESYSAQRCEDLLRLAPGGVDRLFAIAHGERVEKIDSRWTRKPKVRSAGA